VKICDTELDENVVPYTSFRIQYNSNRFACADKPFRGSSNYSLTGQLRCGENARMPIWPIRVYEEVICLFGFDVI